MMVLAHFDLATSMKKGPDQLPGISRKMIEEVLGLIRKFMNQIERHYLEKEIAYEDFVMPSDGDALVATLRYGLRYEELLQDGMISPDDWHHGQ